MNNVDGVSVVVPFLNEEDGILFFCKTLDEYAKSVDFPIELIFVDDGSVDQTLSILLTYQFEYISDVTLIKFSKNFGFQSAVRAGFLKAKFSVSTWMSVDLQEPLDMISVSYRKIMSERVDVVFIEKESIDVSFISRSCSKVYYWLMKTYAIRNYPQVGVGGVAFNSIVREYLNSNIESNSAVLLQLMDAGFKQEYIPMEFSAREMGQSKWTFSKKLKILIDSFVSFSYAPIRMVSSIGIFIFAIGFIIALVTVINKYIHQSVTVGYSTIVSVLAMGFGITNISLGIIAEYLWRTFDVAKHKVPFIISEEVVIKENEESDR